MGKGKNFQNWWGPSILVKTIFRIIWVHVDYFNIFSDFFHVKRHLQRWSPQQGG